MFTVTIILLCVCALLIFMTLSISYYRLSKNLKLKIQRSQEQYQQLKKTCDDYQYKYLNYHDKFENLNSIIKEYKKSPYTIVSSDEYHTCKVMKGELIVKIFNDDDIEYNHICAQELLDHLNEIV